MDVIESINFFIMQSLYESKYQVLLFSEKDKMLISDWKTETRSLNEATYLVEIHKLFSYFRRIKPLRYYCDISNINNILTKEAQEFSANLFKNDKAKYSAIVTNHPSILPFVESIVNELEVLSDDFVNRYFQDKTTAMNWLLSCGSEPTNLKSSEAAVNQL